MMFRDHDPSTPPRPSTRLRPRAGLCLLTMLLLSCITSPLAADDAANQVRERLDQPPKPHPRLFFHADQTQHIHQRIESESLMGGTWELIRTQADAMLELDPVERDQVGRRLLAVSRTVLKRVSYLALAYRLTGEAAYLERAEREMLAATAFSDWNPSHFLDVGEMTAALAIGYDWLHDDLSSESRSTIREAIVEKGLNTSFEHAGWWVSTSNNWAPVCHGGLTMGALAVMEHEPELAERVISRALANIHRPMDVYGPNGAYPEGPMYWQYGTSFNVLLIDALASALGTDFGLSDHERFMTSPEYYLHVHGPATGYFNYSDSRETSSVAEAMYWFARRLDRPDLLWIEKRKLAEHLEQDHSADGFGNRLLAFLLIWAGDLEDIEPPDTLHYADEGETPIGVHRSGWDGNAVYVGLKAGTPRANHGQMDIGSFVMESDGVRWAIDLGLQGYHSLESRGINLWDRSQDGDRWTVFRMNNRSHNTLVVNDQFQRAAGSAPITAFADEGPMPHTIIDMREVYAGQLEAAARGVALVDDVVVVQDELQAGDEQVEVRWGMVTRAEVEIVDGHRAILRQDGQRLGFEVATPDGAELTIFDTATPPADHDAANPGTRMIGFKIILDSAATQPLTVQLTPGGLTDDAPEIAPLIEW